ncbi:MAG: amino acid permease [Cyanobacteria bacterium HKST-UBA04]|nr:amino acid permease [Cyanobacteria bacterium HKST-UBA04]
MASLFRTKPLQKILAQSQAHKGRLKRTLSAFDLTALGIGAIIGTGIFVLTGTAAADKAGPALMLSFMFAGVACAFSALCYAEFASMLPIAGSAYTYAYSTVGELMAWIIGWDLILEYAIGSGAVASGWSHYLQKLAGQYGLIIPDWLSHDTLTYMGLLKEGAVTASPLMLGGMPIAFNLPASLVALFVTVLLVIGIKESARTNALIVFVKVAIILFIIVAGFFYIKPEHWTPFFPYGADGILAGAGTIFFAYIGFDAVSTAAEEAKNPTKDLPVGIIASLAVCTLLYILVTAVITGMVPYNLIDRGAPLAAAFSHVGQNWAAYIISVGAVAGLTSVLLVLMMSMPRIFFAMSRDGLLWPWFGHVHEKFGTPSNATILTGLFVAFVAGFTPIEHLAEMTSIGTLFAFSLVCAAVIILRRKAPEQERKFRVPWVPVLPVLGILFNAVMMVHLQPETWIRLVVWLVLGFIIYFGYGNKHSKLNADGE